MGFKDKFLNKNPLRARSVMKSNDSTYGPYEEDSPEYSGDIDGDGIPDTIDASPRGEGKRGEEYVFEEYEPKGNMMPGIIGKAHKQKKWWKYNAGFGGGWGGGRQIPANATPAQKLQKSLGDELSQRANVMVAATLADDSTSSGAAQGIHLEAVYRSPQFQAYMARELTNFAKKHGTEAANQINTKLWEGWDYNADGTMSHGDDLTGSGITKERAKWKQSEFRSPTDDEREAYANSPRYEGMPRAAKATMRGGSPEDMIKYYANGDKKKERKLKRFLKRNPELFEGLSTDPYS